MIRILGLGDNTIDTYVDAGVQYPGGNAVNVAAMTARLGADAAYLGCFGDDDGGALLQRALRAEGVDLTRARTRPGANARAMIGHVNGDRRFLGSKPGVRSDYRWEEDDFAYMAQFDHVHTSIYSELGDVLPRIAESAPSLSFDASDRWTPSFLEKVLPHVRVAFLSAAAQSRDNATLLAEDCLAHGPEVVVVTRGSQGAIALSAAGEAPQEALPTTVVDTLGAGDGFISGFLMSYLSGSTVAEAMTGGAAFAAQVCSWHGGFGHSAPWQGRVGDAA